ncbi:MAG: HAMP domain-containing histidine kinase [Bdellovibrionales bacterium]|nr:HAMP domain-containing histidine kinase [Bdellovibrionales bacterium]
MGSLSLQQRIAATLLAFSLLVALLISGIGNFLNESIEASIWQDTLDSALEFYLEQKRIDPNYLSSSVGGLAIFTERDEALPQEFRSLPIGVHDELSRGSREFCILVRLVAGTRYFVLYDITELEERERTLAYAGVFAVGCTLILVTLIGVQLSRWLVASIRDLAERVSSLDPSSFDDSLAEHYNDDEVHRIAKAIDMFRVRLEQFVRREKEFVNMASHEFRTPIAAIAGAVDVLNSLDELPDQARKPLDRIRRNAKELQQMASALLFLAREAKIPDLGGEEQTAVQEIAKQVVADFQPLAERKGIRIQVEALHPTSVAAQPTLVSIVVSNLLRNALQHSYGQTISLRLRDGVLSVTDDGTGMTDAQLAAARAAGINPVEVREERRGLGFYIVNQIAQRFGWHVVIERTGGGGSRVELHFLGVQPSLPS